MFETKKLFISQPMGGKISEEILAVREKAIASAKEKINDDIKAINSFIQNAPSEAKPLWFLGISLELLAMADIAYFAKGWEESRGCRIEHQCALDYGIPMIIEDYTE